MNKKKETICHVCGGPDYYCKEFANFATRLDNDLKVLAMVAEELNAMTFSCEGDICKALKLNVQCLRMLENRMLSSAKTLPWANQYYYARQDPQQGEDFGTDDRKPLQLSKTIIKPQ